MRTRPLGAALVAGALMTLATASHAQQTGFEVNRFEPAERGSHWFTLDSLDLRSKRDARGTKLPVFPAVGLTFDYNNRALVAYNADDTIRASIVRHQLLMHLGASVALFDRLRIGADMPFQLFADGHEGAVKGQVYSAPANEQSLGDLRLSADVGLIGRYGEPVTVAIGAALFVPTGDAANYMSDGSTRVMPRAQIAGDIGMFSYAARLAFQYRGLGQTFAGSPIGSEFNYALSAGVHPFGRDFLIGPELFGSTVVTDGAAFAKQSTPLEGLLGAHLRTKCFWFGAGVGAGLTRGFGAPAVRTLLSVEWAPPWDKPIVNATPLDSDGDGIVDTEDACPKVPGIKTDDPKTNGCPAPPKDRDGDGILDKDDACPELAGVHSDDPKKNGCPSDRDNDNVFDKDDACPDVAGPQNEDPKKNGCPPDKDEDGVFDKDDACIDVPGVKSANPKFNGCPEDMDGDGIKNDVDACPDQKGEPDADPAKNGCPHAVIANGQIKLLDQVRFKTSSAEILPGKDSEDVLQALLKILNEHPELKKVRVEGHTDNRGAAEYNKLLSKNRAASVVKWLTAHGIDGKRLSSAGFGQDNPLTTNDTEEGRQQNRRVEFHVEEK